MMKNFAILALASSVLVPGASAQNFRVSSVESASASGGTAASAASALGSRAPASLSALSIGAASLPVSAVAPVASALAPVAAPGAGAAAPEASAPISAPASARAKATAAKLARPIAAVANASVLAHFAAPASKRDASLDAERIGALYGESQAAAAADGPEVVANEGEAAARSHLAAPAASPAASAARAATPGAPTIGDFAGAWNRVSGNGYDRVEVTSSKDSVFVSGEKYGVHNFNGINGPTTNDAPWRGSFDAPGGLVTRSVTTVFKDGKLEETSFRVEKPWIRWPTALMEKTSLSMSDGRLVLRTEATLYRRTFFYFGPFNVKTRLNTTNLADPARPLATVVYQRAGQAPLAAAQEPAAAVRGSGSAASVLVKTAAAAAYAAAATPLLAATPAAAAASSHPVLKVGAGAVVGAVAGFSATAGIYHFRHRNDSHGDFDFSVLGDLFFGLIGAVVGGIAGAVIGAAL